MEFFGFWSNKVVKDAGELPDANISITGTPFASRSVPMNAFQGGEGGEWLIFGAHREPKCHMLTCTNGISELSLFTSLNGQAVGVRSGEQAFTLELQQHHQDQHCLCVINLSGKATDSPVGYSVCDLNLAAAEWRVINERCNGIFDKMSPNGRVLMFDDCMFIYVYCYF